jgi:hypothetical protein
MNESFFGARKIFKPNDCISSKDQMIPVVSHHVFETPIMRFGVAQVTILLIWYYQSGITAQALSRIWAVWRVLIETLFCGLLLLPTCQVN